MHCNNFFIITFLIFLDCDVVLLFSVFSFISLDEVLAWCPSCHKRSSGWRFHILELDAMLQFKGFQFIFNLVNLFFLNGQFFFFRLKHRNHLESYLDLLFFGKSFWVSWLLQFFKPIRLLTNFLLGSLKNILIFYLLYNSSTVEWIHIASKSKIIHINYSFVLC